jgi:hypothetical protein
MAKKNEVDILEENLSICDTSGVDFVNCFGRKFNQIGKTITLQLVPIFNSCRKFRPRMDPLNGLQEPILRSRVTTLRVA